jgi:hypothetical protein
VTSAQIAKAWARADGAARDDADRERDARQHAEDLDPQRLDRVPGHVEVDQEPPDLDEHGARERDQGVGALRANC